MGWDKARKSQASGFLSFFFFFKFLFPPFVFGLGVDFRSYCPLGE